MVMNVFCSGAHIFKTHLRAVRAWFLNYRVIVRASSAVPILSWVAAARMAAVAACHPNFVLGLINYSINYMKSDDKVIWRRCVCAATVRGVVVVSWRRGRVATQLRRRRRDAVKLRPFLLCTRAICGRRAAVGITTLSVCAK